MSGAGNPGVRKALRTTVALAGVLWAAGGCFWKYGFAGGGLPTTIKTVAVLPFDNNTPNPDLQLALYNALHPAVNRRLGLNDASESRADAVVSGTIQRYDTDVPVGYAGGRNVNPSASTTQRELELAVDVTIVEQSSGKTLWERKGLIADATYQEGNEAGGRTDAIKKLVDEIIEGAQSQW
jgi:Lipopolysaccharide-assembly